MKFCPNCGAELKPDARFCVVCGTALSATVQPPAQPSPPPQPDYRQQQPLHDYPNDGTNAYSDTIKGRTNLVQRVINIMIKPNQEWIVIAGEPPDAIKLVGGYALVLALIPALSSFIKYGIIGFSFMDSSLLLCIFNL